MYSLDASQLKWIYFRHKATRMYYTRKKYIIQGAMAAKFSALLFLYYFIWPWERFSPAGDNSSEGWTRRFYMFD